jgi:uncharacterized protein (DUF1015 family)
MRLFAFEGLRYTDRAGDAGALAAPPYDQINDKSRDRFHAESPHQFVHLSVPVAADGGDPYRHAADLHARWLADGILAREPKPALYPYAIELEGGGRRLGVQALVGLEDAAHIRPHEQTLDKPLADRLKILETTRIDLEPALFLAEDDGALETLIAEDVAASQPVVTHVDADGHRHQLYKVDDPARIARYQQAVDGRTAAIADGHHRYKVAQKFAEAHGGGTGASATKLAVVTSIASPELTIDPIHRAFREAIDLSRLASLAHESKPGTAESGAGFAAEVAAAAQPAIGFWPHGGTPEIWSFGEGAPRLAVEVFQKWVLPALGLPAEASTDGTVVYRAVPDELGTQVVAGELGTGIFLPPMQPAEFSVAIADGAMLPPKSTRFLPKVMSGLVWADHDAKVV